MDHKKKFTLPVYKNDGTNRLIEVGDTVTLIQKDGTPTDVTVTAVSGDGRWVSWASAPGGIRRDDVRAVDGDHVWDCTQYGGNAAVEDPIEWPEE